MSTENSNQTEINAPSNSTFKWLIGILGVLLLALTVYTVKLHTDSQKTQDTLELQKMDIENELQALLVNYNTAIEDNNVKDKDLIAARERIESLLDSLKVAQADVDLIKRYKIEVGKLKTEKEYLIKRADSLQLVAHRMEYERDSTNVVLDETIRVVDSIALQNQALATIVEKGQTLKLSKLYGEGVKVRNNGKIVQRDRANQIDKMRTCFTINANEIAEKGDRLLFIQVINPRNNVVGEKSVVNFEDKVLTYSATSNVFYENEELDVCVLVNAIEADLVSGNYQVNVFDGPKMVASTSLQLK